MKNKTVTSILFFICTIVCLSSCSSTQRFTVHGAPGTIIATQDGQNVMIDQSGRVQLTMGRAIGGYCHFLLSKAPNSNIWVPFAIDYKDHPRGFNKAMGILFSSISMGGSVTCAAMAIGGAGEAVLLPGIAALGGLGLALPFALNSDDTYDCLDQHTNNDLIR